MAIIFRPLTEQEIEVRVSRVSQYGVDLLLFKDSRCDMRILDETFGMENWQNRFYECKGTLFCEVSVCIDRGNGLCEWVSKANAGAPSNVEAQKGEASDAFKRACFTLGIGRELYTAPRIWVPSAKAEIYKDDKGRLVTKTVFHVEKIAIEDGRITGIRICNSAGAVMFSWKES